MADIDALFAAAVARHQSNDLAGAESAYREVLRIDSRHAASWCNLGVLLARVGRADEAAACYLQALAASPGHPDAHFNLGNLYRRAGRLPEAVAEYRCCLAAAPEHTGALFNLGLSLSALDDLPAAIQAFHEVIRLEPANADAFMRLGDCQMRQGQMNEAVASFRQAVARAPNDPRSHYNLGLGLTNLGAFAEARAALGQALCLRPDYAEAHNALGLTLEATGQKDDAVFHYQQAVQFRPDFADAWSNLGTNLSEHGRIDEAIHCLRHSLSLRPDAAAIHSNLLLMMNYSSRFSADEIVAEHCAWAERHAGPAPLPPPIPRPHDPDRRLRIGYLSADYRRHTVAGFLELLLRHHDRSQVEVFAYANVLRPDDVTDRLRALADHWRRIVGRSDAVVAEQIRQDQIDILVDLGGHTAGNRLLVLARRPAPVQISLFGYPNTTGMAAVDYRITDPWTDPIPDAGQAHASRAKIPEQSLRLPEVAWIYRPPEAAPPPGPLPSLSQSSFTLGCLNNAAKLSDACLDAWIAILQAVPATRLVLLAGQAEAGVRRLIERVTRRGILRDRLEVRRRMPPEEYLAAHRQLDLYLDPFPYNGGVTSCDALWMGVPVLTVAGSNYCSRQGLGLMTHLGLTEFIVNQPDELVSRVAEWNRRRSELAEIRRGLRNRLAKSVICDVRRYLQNLESAYRRVWRERLPG